ncbi:Stk1 family PASTA domain-containing Ser/Thr kinase [Janibacter sp. GS2]|uniref:Stk1 family PASTA domain-containing Ser/Thr kinase n=1 Tax=Janibacter sp. GS2 TaxID=3442646 RepID=UPI003EBBD939
MSTSAPRLLGGRYEVGELIGRGGMAEVHLGHDARLGRPVAIKILRTDHARDTAFLTRFRREAQSVAGLNHRSIVAVYDSGEERVEESGGASLDIPYIVMEYVDGQTLREVLNDTPTGTLDPGEAAHIVQQVLEALDYSHDMGIVHRDIKPGNVMITDDGNVKVMDFGIARAIADTQATMTQTQAVIGTAQYISPEQARGETVDKRSDVYSTGCLLFELLTARTPYTGEPISLTYQHVNAEIPLPSSVNPDVPAELDAIVVHSLTKDRDERYPDAKSMAEDLEAYGAGRPISPVATSRLEGATTALPVTAPRAEASPARRDDPDTASMPATGERRRGSRLGWLIAALLLIPLGLLGWFAWSASQGEEVVEVTVPNVVGREQSVATADLKGLGLDVATRTTASQKPAGQVVAQDPEENTTLAEGEEVTLTVSDGPEDASVPNVVGKSRQEATTALEDAGLKVGDVTETDSPDQGKNKVISTQPAVSETVQKGESVDLVVASGDVELQDFTGQDIADVRSDIYDLRLKVAEEPQSSSQEPGTILQQRPGAGTIPQGRTVTFVVAEKPAATVTTTTSPSTTEEPSETTDPSESSSSSSSSPSESSSSSSPSTTEEPEPTSTSPTSPLEPTPSEPSDTKSTSKTTQSPPSP